MSMQRLIKLYSMSEPIMEQMQKFETLAAQKHQYTFTFSVAGASSTSET
jgi:hypothetical protein